MNETYYRNLTDEELVTVQRQQGTTLLERELAARLVSSLDRIEALESDLDVELKANNDLHDKYDEVEEQLRYIQEN